MEEKKLLRILIIFLVGFYGQVAFASNNDDNKQWASEIAANARQINIEKIKSIMGEAGFDQELRQAIIKPRPSLQIFVSSGMPIQLLKGYAKEAKRYGGVLVLRGLPKGSIHKLTDFVMKISSDNSAAIQIDDTAYAKFEITTVPAIILSKPETIFSEDANTSPRFDKVTGSVTIKAALEMFASKGAMASEAKELMR